MKDERRAEDRREGGREGRREGGREGRGGEEGGREGGKEGGREGGEEGGREGGEACTCQEFRPRCTSHLVRTSQTIQAGFHHLIKTKGDGPRLKNLS